MPFAEESEIPKPRANPNEKINETQLIASIIQEQQQAEAIAGFKAQRSDWPVPCEYYKQLNLNPDMEMEKLRAMDVFFKAFAAELVKSTEKEEFMAAALLEMKSKATDYSMSLMPVLVIQKYLEASKETNQMAIEGAELEKQTNKVKVLEGISRELQRKYREIQEENKTLKKSEGDKVKAIEAHFQKYAQSLKANMEKEFQAINKGKEEKNSLKNKFKGLLEEYQTREKHFKAVVDTKDSEYSLIQAKYDLLNEKLIDSNESCKKVNRQLESALERENELKSQSHAYNIKLREAEETLRNSNDMFVTYRTQLDLMTEKLKGLQQEHYNIKEGARIIELESEALHAKLEEAEAKNKKLESLCRALQDDRQKSRDKG